MRKPAETIADPFAPEAPDADVESPSEASPADSSKRRGWRRLLQVNLLMVLVALALVSGYFAMRRNFLVPYLEQKAAREELAKRGAAFSAVPASPKWVQALFQISDDDFQNVEMIKLENSDGIRDADLIHLHKFPHLRRLYLAATRVTDDGMKHLRYCTKLRRISLWDTQVGDAGIRELETLQDLRIIDIHRTWTTDAALETLGKLPALEELILDDATTKRGIAHLSGLRNLRRLGLRSTHLQADCLELLADCPIEILETSHDFADRDSATGFRHVPRIRAVSATMSGATDEDLTWLAQMTNLRSLNLHDLQADGAFVRHLDAMRELSELHLSSDRFRKQYVEAAMNRPRLTAATITSPLEPTDIPRTPKSGKLGMPYYRSPWIMEYGYHATGQGADGARFGWPVEGFGTGDALRYENHQKLYMTGESLAPLLAQRRLKDLSLQNWEFAPGALASLAQLDRLESVTFAQCRFEPEELEAFAKLPNLRSVIVRGVPIRDEQLAAFVAAPRLEALEVHLTDASAATVLDLAKKESLNYLSIYSTTLDDAFLDQVDAILAPRVRSAAKAVVEEGAQSESLPQFSFVSTGFSEPRAAAFRNRFTIAVGVAKEPGVEAPDGYWGVWPTEGSFLWIDPARPVGLELSPLDIDLPIDESADQQSASRASHWFAAIVQLGNAYSWSFQSLSNSQTLSAPGSMRPGGSSPWANWRVAAAVEPQQVVQLPLDRFGAGTTRRMLEIDTHTLSLTDGTAPPECLEALARSKARAVILAMGIRYDAPTLRAIAQMPILESIHFAGCRKPSAEEVAMVLASPTLATVMLEHRGEPIYFREIEFDESRQTPVKLIGKVVYDWEDAIRTRPTNLILANFQETLWPAILDDPRSITEIYPRNDWPNQHRLRLRLEVQQRERDEAAQAIDDATR